MQHCRETLVFVSDTRPTFLLTWYSYPIKIQNWYRHKSLQVNPVRCYMQRKIMVHTPSHHYGDVIMSAIASQITSLTIVYSTVYSDADQRKHQSSASLAFVRVIHRGPVNSPHKWPVTRKMFPFDDVIMTICCIQVQKRYSRITHLTHWGLNKWVIFCRQISIA